MKPIQAKAARDFAVHVVQRLRVAGFESVWAGGCVRDQLLGRVPKDYDVATSATPEEVRQVFGKRKTLPIGASFGVITVLGPKNAGQIEVATFRQDAEYSDGRHPDHVTFSDAQQDALRRDFTINGLFYDPLQQAVIDYVGGESDIQRKVVRAIGDPGERIAEDKLRMLRAVRFAATFSFALEPQTLAAVQQHAGQMVVVSAERIAAEMRRILVHSTRRRAIELLHWSGLLAVILPELNDWMSEQPEQCESWLKIQTQLDDPSFPLALASLLWPVTTAMADGLKLVEVVSNRWKLANEETRRAHWMLCHEATLRKAQQLPWPQLQRVLIAPDIRDGLELATHFERSLTGKTSHTDYCRERLQLDPDQLNPAPLLTGDDLISHGITPGKQFAVLLEAVRDAQLNESVKDRDEALLLVDRLCDDQD